MTWLAKAVELASSSEGERVRGPAADGLDRGGHVDRPGDVRVATLPALPQAQLAALLLPECEEAALGGDQSTVIVATGNLGDCVRERELGGSEDCLLAVLPQPQLALGVAAPDPDPALPCQSHTVTRPAGELHHVVGQAGHLAGPTDPLQAPAHPQLALGVAAHGPDGARPRGHHCVGPAAGDRHHLVWLEDLDTAGLDHVTVVSQAQLAPLVTAEGEDSPWLSEHGGVLVPAGEQHHTVILDPELAGRVVSKLGLPEREDRSRARDLGVLHAEPQVILNWVSTHPTLSSCLVNTRGTHCHILLAR